MAKENQQPNYENLITTRLLTLILLPLVKTHNHLYSFQFPVRDCVGMMIACQRPKNKTTYPTHNNQLFLR
jgi:hypothetical protein